MPCSCHSTKAAKSNDSVAIDVPSISKCLVWSELTGAVATWIATVPLTHKYKLWIQYALAKNADALEGGNYRPMTIHTAHCGEGKSKSKSIGKVTSCTNSSKGELVRFDATSNYGFCTYSFIQHAVELQRGRNLISLKSVSASEEIFNSNMRLISRALRVCFPADWHGRA